MVSAMPDTNLTPVQPEWMQRQGQQGRRTDRTINDIYWKRSERESSPGWIIMGPSAIPGSDGRPLAMQAERWIRKGRVPLVEYSYTDQVSPITGHRETIEPATATNRMGTDFRYYWLFKNGGAYLFPIEQIVEHHWHIQPPFGLSVDVFPQLREWDVPDPFWCGACPQINIPHNSEEQLITHLLITHRMSLPQARELLASYDVHTKPSGTRGIVLRRKAVQIEEQAEEKVVVASPDQPKARLLICNACGAQFSTNVEKARHSRKGVCPASQPAGAMNGQVESNSDG